MSSTVYDVKVRYTLDDKATQGAKSMAREFDRAGQKASSLRGAIAGLGLAGVFVAGKRALVDFNSEIDQMRIGMTTILNMQLKKPWDDAKKSADGLFARFQELAKKSPATTKDFITMANAITPMIASMGGGVDKIERITQGAVLAGIATGTRADVAALDVKQMLAGTVTERDMMANQLLSSQGMKKEDFNAMGGAARGAMVEKLLQDPALLRAADEFGASFAGQVSTFKDQLQIALGSIGKPLMASMTEEVKRWNTWIEKHPKLIARISAQLSGMLKSSFQSIRTVAGWFVENREILMTIAKTYLVFKGAQLGANIFKSFANGMTGLVGQMRSAGQGLMGVVTGGGGLVGGFKSLLGTIAGGLPIIAGLFTAVGSLADMFSITRETAADANYRQHFDERLGKAGTLAKQIRTGPTGAGTENLTAEQKTRLQDIAKNEFLADENMVTLFREFYGDGMKAAKIHYFRELDNGGTVATTGVADADKAMLDYKDSMSWFNKMEDLSAVDVNRLNRTDAGRQLLSEMQSVHDIVKDLSFDRRQELHRLAFPELYPKDKLGDSEMPDPYSGWKDPDAGKKVQINATINVEVASDDPDRFVFGMVKAIRQINTNPTQAASSIGD